MKKLMLGVILFTAQLTLAKNATKCSDIFQTGFFDSLLSDIDTNLEAWHPKYGVGYITKNRDRWIFDQNWERGHRDIGSKVKDKVAILLPEIDGLDSLNPALGYNFKTILDVKRDMPLYHNGKFYKTYAVLADRKILVRGNEGLIKLSQDQVKRGILALSPQFLKTGEVLYVVIDGEVNGVARITDINGLFAEIYFELDKDHFQSSIYRKYSHRIIRVPISYLSRQSKGFTKTTFTMRSASPKRLIAERNLTKSHLAKQDLSDLQLLEGKREELAELKIELRQVENEIGEVGGPLGMDLDFWEREELRGLQSQQERLEDTITLLEQEIESLEN
ncbi:MAG: hypothetical protein A4S09_11465 [Proteobacteria bacterium SG_bin7]|nr:MAG: hypothetical protein A4S09_11465 [Proteobacteria bacterium SG_bin7]